MSNWIDKLKEEHDAKSFAEQRRNETRLHNADLITSKAPDLWKRLLGQVKSDSETLNDKFPKDPKYRTGFSETSESGFTLRNNVLPMIEMRAVPNFAAHVVQIDIARKADRVAQEKIELSEIRFAVRGDAEVIMQFGGNDHIDLAALSEAIFKIVCNLC